MSQQFSASYQAHVRQQRNKTLQRFAYRRQQALLIVSPTRRAKALAALQSEYATTLAPPKPMKHIYRVNVSA
jgi:hypothetical protein